MIILQRLSDLPSFNSAAIFGTGEGGFNFLRLLDTYRPDIDVLGMIDTFYSGEKNGMKVFDLREFMRQYDDSVWVLVASRFWQEMTGDLVEYGHEPVIVVPDRFLLSNAAARLENHPSLDPKDNPLEKEWFSASHREQWRRELLNSQALLHEPGDRKLYRLLTGDTRGNLPYTQALCDYYYFSPLLGQYRDYIRYNHVNTIIEGGVFDGKSTIQFLKDAGDDTQIFGFEPNYENFRKGDNFKTLDKLDNVEILPYGLWSGSGNLHFIDDGCGTRFVSPEAPEAAKNSGHKIISLDVMSIDEFVKDRAPSSIDLIKLDVEGAEPEALEGARNTLKQHRPQLAISIYHRREHMFQLPLLLDRLLENYVYRIGHYAQDFKETVWYAIPQEIYR